MIVNEQLDTVDTKKIITAIGVERGHYARECSEVIPPPAKPPITQAAQDTLTKLISINHPPKVTQTITSEGQLPMEAWNVLLEQLGHAQAENKQMKKFVKKYVPFNKRNNDYHKQNPKPNKQMQQSETDEEIVPKVNKVEVHNESDEDEELAYMLWNLQMENETYDPHHDVECDNGAHANHTPQINVILSNTGMALEFPVQIDSFTTKCLFDSGASHSCMSYRCFKSAFPTEAPEDINGLTVQNASGKSMKPLGKYDVTITLGKKKFTHEFIICEELTSAVIIGLDFSS